jgi:hypothetical protein
MVESWLQGSRESKRHDYGCCQGNGRGPVGHFAWLLPPPFFMNRQRFVLDEIVRTSFFFFSLPSSVTWDLTMQDVEPELLKDVLRCKDFILARTTILLEKCIFTFPSRILRVSAIDYAAIVLFLFFFLFPPKF